MNSSPLISTEELSDRISQPGLQIFDCRFNLAEPGWGRQSYLDNHVPGAIYADLNHDLAAPVGPFTGRHPLPDPAEFAQTLARWGVTPQSQIVVYDAADGSLASRLWWMLRSSGHPNVLLLDGGYAKWTKECQPVRSGEEVALPAPLMSGLQFDPNSLVNVAQVEIAAYDPSYRLIDARAPERFQGLVEPIDRVAGHIPGAVNRFYGLNLNPQGMFKSSDELRWEFLSLLGDTPASQAVVYCGSGVTSCHHIVALQHAGLPEARVYVGSWSEWSRDPSRPIATGK
jgi:thiosulfate/3-mercaptopyruvate sulfurtransferase